MKKIKGIEQLTGFNLGLSLLAKQDSRGSIIAIFIVTEDLETSVNCTFCQY